MILTATTGKKLTYYIIDSNVNTDKFVYLKNGRVNSYVGTIRDNKCIVTTSSTFRDDKHPVFVIINKILNDEPVSFDIKVK